MMYGSARTMSRNSVLALLLLVLFAVSFSLPFVITFKLSNLFTRRYGTSFSEEALFRDATSIPNANTYISVEKNQALLPVEGKDLVVTVWAKLNRESEKPGRIVFLSKTDGSSDDKDSYSIGLIRDKDIYRPVVYWGNSERGGKWFTFSPLNGTPQNWTMYALSFVEGRFVGMHVANFDSHGKIKVSLLGGYEIDPGSSPSKLDPIRIGAWGRGRFRGKVGPFAIFQKSGLGEDLSKFVKLAAQAPAELPSLISRADASVWAPSSRNDRGPLAIGIDLVSPNRK